LDIAGDLLHTSGQCLITVDGFSFLMNFEAVTDDQNSFHCVCSAVR